MLMVCIWALSHMPQITVAPIPWDVVINDKIDVKKRKKLNPWWVWLMVALNGGVQGRLYCFSWPALPPTPPPPPPHSFMWIKACRLFNSSFERRGDQGEAEEGGGLLAGCLCCAVAGRPSRDSARLRCGETRQGLPSGLMPCNED